MVLDVCIIGCGGVYPAEMIFQVTRIQLASQHSVARAWRIALPAWSELPWPVATAFRAAAATLQCNLARVSGLSEFTNAIAALGVLISEGNVRAEPPVAPME
jgi:hypothetical protein